MEEAEWSDTGKKGILVVSFGTSHEDTRAVTIDAIEKEIGAAFTDCKFIAHGPAK